MNLYPYRPQRARPELLEKTSVGREPLLREVLGRLGRWRADRSRQHYLFIGPRGIGKTHLLRLFNYRVRSDAALRARWLPILLAEEPYSISRVSDLLLEMLRQLSTEGGQNGTADAAEVYEAVRFDEDDQRVCDRCLDAFRQFHRQTGRGILLMMENLDRLLERQVRRRSEVHRLRKILIEEDWLVTLCTSPTFLNAVSQPEEPFFEFFDVRPLAELTAEEQGEMLRRLAAAEGRAEVMATVERYQSRQRALYHFTGGSPRLTVMLYDLVAHHRVDTVRNELDLLLEQLTPYYQDRMRMISEQEAKVLEVMALLPEGYSPTELAREARMEAKAVRATLTRLERAGYVRREERRKKRTVYIVPERLFRIWHQMNHSRAARGRVQYLLEFFSGWYATREERDEIWEELAAAFDSGREDAEELDGIAEYMGYLAAVSEGDERLKRSFERLRAMAQTAPPEAIAEELQDLDGELGEVDDYFLHKGYFLANELRDQEAALEAFQEAVGRKRDDLVAQFNRAVALERAGLWAEADDAYRQTAALLTRQDGEESVEELKLVLGQLLRESGDGQVVEIAGRLLKRLGVLPVGDLIATLRTAAEPRRRGAAATLLGRTGSRAAVEPLVRALEDPAHNVRGSAATALGRLADPAAVESLVRALEDPANEVRGSAATALGRLADPSAVDPLLRALEDPANNVRGSAGIALGRIADQLSGSEVEDVIGVLIDSATRNPRVGRYMFRIFPILLRAALSSGDQDLILETIQVITDELAARGRSTPYEIAAEYLSSNRDPAVLERQQPEIREAVLLLVDLPTPADRETAISRS